MRISDWSSDVCSSDVGAFHARAVDEDLAIRARLGQVRHAGGVELEPDVVLVAAVVVDLVVAGAQGGVDDAHEAAHDAVLVRSEEHTSELQSLMRISYAVFCL